MVFILDSNNFFCLSSLAMEGNLPYCRNVRYRAVGSTNQLAFQLRYVLVGYRDRYCTNPEFVRSFFNEKNKANCLFSDFE
jgi:hypothetical protein